MAIRQRNTRAAPRSNRFRDDGSRLGSEDRYAEIHERVQRRLLSELSPGVEAGNPEEVRRAIARIFGETLTESRIPMSRTERAELFEQIVAGILGYGPIESLLRDDSVTEILVNGPKQVYVERHGILEETGIVFLDNTEDMRKFPDARDAPEYIHRVNDAFTVADLTIEADLGNRIADLVAARKVVLKLQVNNLTDQLYTTFGFFDGWEPVWIPAATRSVYAGLVMDW